MQDSSDYALQTYRTVCREIAIKEHQLRHYKNTLEDFRRRREEWGRKRLEDAFRNKFRIDSEFEVKSFGIDVDDIVKELEKNLDQTEQDIKCFKNTFLTPFVNLDKSGRVSLTLFQHTLTERLPVALAGRGNFSILDSKGSSKRKDILAVINVLPTKKGTEIFICVSNEHKDALLVYISNFTGKEVDRKGVIRMVESWMLHGSDHWFLAPSAWLSLSVDQQTSVIEAIKDLNYNIGAQPAVPILDTTKNCP